MIRPTQCRELPDPLEGVAVPKTKTKKKTTMFVLSAIPLALIASACSSGGNAASNSTTTTPVFVAPTFTVAPTTTISPQTTLPAESTTTTTTISTTATNWEVVVGIWTTSAKAQEQIDKLTAAKFAGFSIKPVTGKFAAVLPGLTNAAATAMASKINAAKVGAARVFHLTGAASTNFEVVDGIFLTSADAQAQIDKLTAAKFLGFSIKPVTGKFAVVLPGLTSVQATAMVTAIDAAKLGPSRVKQL